jgi:hypothetical protein
VSRIEKLIRSGEVRVRGLRRVFGATLVALLVATQAAGASANQVQTQTQSKETVMKSRNEDSKKIQGYAPVNGLKMYYEIEGTGDPLVFIPPAFGFCGLESFPALVQSHSVITVDVQGHGRTAVCVLLTPSGGSRRFLVNWVRGTRKERW